MATIDIVAKGKSYILAEKFDGNDFAGWKFEMESMLMSAGLHKIVMGHDPKPLEDGRAIDKWLRSDEIARGTIVANVARPHHVYLRGKLSSKEMWDSLCETFDTQTVANEVYLRGKWASIEMKADSSVQQFAREARSILSELSMADIVIDEPVAVAHFLFKLPPDFKQVVSHLSSQPREQLKWSIVEPKLLHEEQLMKFINAQSKVKPLDAALIITNSKTTNKFANGSKETRKCYVCDKVGHLAKDCWHNVNNGSGGRGFNKEQPSTNFRQGGASTNSRGRGYAHKPRHNGQRHHQAKHEGGNNRGNGKSNGAQGQSTYLNHVSVDDSDGSSFPHECMEVLMATNFAKMKSDDWIVDTGASVHISHQRDIFTDFKDVHSQYLTMANGEQLQAMGIGTIELLMMVDDVEIPFSLKHVLYAPGMSFNIFSLHQEGKSGMTAMFYPPKCELRNVMGHVRAQATETNTLYRLHCRPRLQASQGHVMMTGRDINVNLWHRRLSHVNQGALSKLVHQERGSTQDAIVTTCEACQIGKHSRSPFHSRDPSLRATKPLMLVHSDLCGPLSIPSIGGASYFLTFIDDHSRMAWVYFLKTKDETFSHFKAFKALVENESGLKIKALRHDGGGEYVSHEFRDYCKSQGIVQQITTPYSPQQNGVAERLNRTIMDAVRSMLHHQRLSASFWGEATNTAIYCRNRIPHSSLSFKTPYELWYGKRSTLGHLRVWGCMAFVHVNAKVRTKLDDKAKACIFIGYDSTHMGYRFWDPKAKKIIVRRDATFWEDVRVAEEDVASHHEERPRALPHVVINEEMQVPSLEDERERPLPPQYEHEAPPMEDQHAQHVTDQMAASSDRRPQSASSSEMIAPRGVRSMRDILGAEGQRQAPREELRQVHGAPINPQAPPLPNPPLRRSPRFIHAIKSIPHEDPLTVEEAMSRTDAPKWRQAMEEELDAMRRMKTWELVDLPEGRQAVKCKWVFKLKRNQDDSIERYRARLVAKGFSQKEGLDYNETFSPTLKHTSIRVILALVALYDWEVHQVDVATAFLNGVLQEEVFMCQPDGFVIPGKEKKVCRLKKSIYGLKQSSRVWNEDIDLYLQSIRFIRSMSDPCVYVRDGDPSNIIGLYVDDQVVTGRSIQVIEKTKREIAMKYDIKDLGPSKKLLGWEIVRDRVSGLLSISQTKLIEKALDRFGMASCNSSPTPLDPGLKLSQEHSPKTNDEKLDMIDVPYQALIGTLMYLMVGTRPDIAYAVGVLSQFMHNPGRAHWEAAKRVLRYLRGTKSMKITYMRSSGGAEVKGYSDSDWAGDITTRKSTSGYVFTMASGVIAWSSRKQASVATSTAEAEYVAAAMAAREALWLRQLLGEMHQPQETATPIYIDNQAALTHLTNPMTTPKSKHIDIAFHFVRDHIHKGHLIFIFVSTKFQVADVFTKALSTEPFKRCIDALGTLF